MQAAAWRALIPLTRRERFIELTLPLPWLMVSLCLYATPWWGLGFVAAFYFFLTGLRLSHNAQHCSLGVGRRVHDGVLFALSVAMGASMHAVQATHLNHHRHALNEHDIEGRVASLGFPRILFAGPRFIFDLHRFALTKGRARQRAWVVAELLAIAALWVTALASDVRWLQLHVLAMLVGEAMTAFFAVWIVHREADAVPSRSRTERKSWVNFLTYNMLLHAEHHAYPAVPTIHWPHLARLRDEARERVELDVARRD
jgi:fatty acid desaturase